MNCQEDENSADVCATTNQYPDKNLTFEKLFARILKMASNIKQQQCIRRDLYLHLVEDAALTVAVFYAHCLPKYQA